MMLAAIPSRLTSTFAGAAVLSFALATLGAADDMSRDALAAALLGADGEVVVLMAGRVDLPALEGGLDALAVSAVASVRFGIARDVADAGRPVRREVLAAVEGRRLPGWQVCPDWLKPWKGYATSLVADELIARYGGSIVVIDGGANDRARFHSETGEDPLLGIAENPILAGLLDGRTAPAHVTDPNLYRGAWQAVDGIAATDVHGC